MEVRYIVKDESMAGHEIGQFSSHTCAAIFAKAYAHEYRRDLKRNQVTIWNARKQVGSY